MENANESHTVGEAPADLVEDTHPNFSLVVEEACDTSRVRRKNRAPDLRHERYEVDEAAGLLGLNPTVIRHAVSAGQLKAERVGHNIVCIERSDLLDWLNRRGPGV